MFPNFLHFVWHKVPDVLLIYFSCFLMWGIVHHASEVVVFPVQLCFSVNHVFWR